MTKLFQRLRRLLTSRDDKPVKVSFILENDDCSRLLARFNETDLETCRYLLLVWQDSQGDVQVLSSENCDVVHVVGLLEVGKVLVNGR